jgi:hypothetical protein
MTHQHEENKKMQNTVHIIISPKGGVGKSLVASLIAGYFLDNGLQSEKELICIDTDPTVTTFSSFKRFNAYRLPNLITNNKINERAFDTLVNGIVSAKNSTHIIDTGASNFVPFMNYLSEGEYLDAFEEEGKKVYFHIPIVGGMAQKECIAGLKNIIPQIPEHVNIVMWLNYYFGNIEVDGKEFKESSIYKDNEERIFADITIAHQTANTFGEDIAKALKSHLSLSESIVSDIFEYPSQRRLKTFLKRLYCAMDPIFGFDSSKITHRAAAE